MGWAIKESVGGGACWGLGGVARCVAPERDQVAQDKVEGRTDAELNPDLRLSRRAAHRASEAGEGPDLAPEDWLCRFGPQFGPQPRGGTFHPLLQL